MKLPDNIKTVIADLDGTIYLGEVPVAGAADAVSRLRRNRRVVFLTNNTSVSSAFYVRKLSKMGIEVDKDDIVTAGHATVYYIKTHVPEAKFFIVGTKEFKRELAENGITESDAPNSVLLSFDTELCYEKLEHACDLIRGGALYIATHPDINCPKDGGFKPDAGSFISLIEASTRRRPDVICGKPHHTMTEYILKKFGDSSEIAMIGDRLYTDMKFADSSGFFSCLVLSGETTMEQVGNYHIKPDITIGSVAELE